MASEGAWAHLVLGTLVVYNLGLQVVLFIIKGLESSFTLLILLDLALAPQPTCIFFQLNDALLFEHNLVSVSLGGYSGTGILLLLTHVYVIN